MKKEIEKALAKVDELAFALGEFAGAALRLSEEQEPKPETPEEKALDMVKHLTEAFNLPVFIADGEEIKPGPLVKPDEK